MIRLCFIFIFTLCTTQVDAQCYSDRHNTTKSNGWISCEKKASPNTSRGSSHWILYQFDEPKSIEAIKIWNSNLNDVSDPAIKDLIIDYTMDGTNWTELGNFRLSSPEGNPFYEGEELAGVQAFSATQLLLTGASTFDSQCAGLAEVKFSLNNSTTATKEEINEKYILLTPNPAIHQVNVSVEAKDFKLRRIELVNVKGQILYSRPETSHSFELSLSEILPGAYFLHLISDQSTVVKKLQIIKP
jgi:hypothetical protein